MEEDTKIVEVTPEPKPRIFAVPDIHGRHDLLDKLLFKLYHEEKMMLRRDKIIFMGDMVDRGPESAQVLERLGFMQEFFPGHVVVLKGNHEAMMLNALKSGNKRGWYYNGGNATMRSFPPEGPSVELLAWMDALPLFHREHGFFFSHAPVPRDNKKDNDEYTEHELTWTYHENDLRLNTDLGCENDGTKIVGLCGHIHRLFDDVMEPRFHSNYWFLDSGCGCSDNAPLVAVEVHSKKVTYAWPENT